MAGFEEFGAPTEDITESTNLKEPANRIESLLAETRGEKQADRLGDAGQGEEQDDEPETTQQAAETEEEPEEQDDGDESEDEELFVAKVNGEEVEVTLDELLQGYSRRSDYTRKTQELAQERQQFESERAKTGQEREQYKYLVNALAAKLKAISDAEGEPDWQKLASEDPAGYVQQKAMWDQRQRQIQAAEAEQQRLQQEEAEKYQRQYQSYLMQEKDSLLSVRPELQEPNKAAEFFAGLGNYAQSLGFSPADIQGITDHRILLLAEKAMKYDQLQSKGKKVQQKIRSRPAPLKPGRSKSNMPAASKRTRMAKERLSRSGDVTDAAAVFEEMFN